MFRTLSTTPAGARRSLAMSYAAAALVAIAVQAYILTFLWPHLANGQLVDPDSYTWLGHVQRLLETGHWYDRVQPRANWPFGEDQHSSRPFDALLLAGAWILTPVMGQEAALFWWGAFVSPACYVALCAAAAWTAVTLFGRWRGPVVILLLAAQFAVVAYSMAARADHHSLLMATFALVLGLTGKALQHPGDRTPALLAGVLSGIGIWLSPELLLLLAAGFGALVTAWLQGGKPASRTGLFHALGLVAGIAVALVVEYGPGGWLVPHYDRVSAVHLVVGLFATVFWVCAYRAETLQATPLQISARVRLTAVGGVLALGGFALLFPGFFALPTTGMDERARIILIDIVMETGGLLPTDLMSLGKFLLYLWALFLAIPTVILSLTRDRQTLRMIIWIYLGLVLAIYIASSLFMLRFAPYAEIVCALAVSDAVVRVVRWAWWERPSRRQLATVGIMLFGAGVLGSAWAGGYIVGSSIVRLPPCHAPLKDMAAFLDPPGQAQAPLTILAMSDLGPELLYRTRHRVISTPSISNQDGAIALFAIIYSLDDRVSWRTVKERRIDYLLICQAAAYNPQPGDPRLYSRLMRREVPQWLEQQPLPRDLEMVYDLYRIRHDSPPTTPDGR